jgi:RNA polymerase sigma-70 factor (ECF subfamily)
MQPTRVARARDAVARIQRGDQRAFNALFLEQYAPLCEFTNALVHSVDVAEDIVQGGFVSVWEGRESWRPRSGPRAYLFGACRNRALDYLRHAHVVSASMHHTGVTFGLGEESVPLPADDVLETLEIRDRLHVAVADLPKRRRQVVELRLEQQLSNREIARALGISVKGVEIQFSRALLDLRRRMSAEARIA